MIALRALLVFLLGNAFLSAFAEGPLKLQRGDRICLVGNALGERLQHHNWFETLLHQNYPDHRLRVRNLCFPADQVDFRLRSKGFASLDEHLASCRASVVVCFFGFNESFAGDAGLEQFKSSLAGLVRHTQQQVYDGDLPPRIALVSPIASEFPLDEQFLEGREHNRRLRRYAAAIAAVAESTNVRFVDLYQPTQRIYAAESRRLTINGVHLNDVGYKRLAPVLIKRLFGKEAVGRYDEAVKQEVAAKDGYWWHRYRTVNSFYIYGDRAWGGFDGTYRNREVMQREQQQFEQLVDYAEQRIWAVASGNEPPAEPELAAPLRPKSNLLLPAGEEEPRYLSSDEQRQQFELKPGYEIELVASEEEFPELANPVALSFDGRGRLWVAAMPSYPQRRPTDPLTDKLLILTDDDGDGRADHCDTYADRLHLPTDFEFGAEGVYVAQQPDILLLRDNDNDGVADERIRQLSGFDSADAHHGIAGMQWGPGGNLYFQEGTFKYSHVETPYGPVALNESGIWRYNPRRESLDVHSRFAFANPWGNVFNRWGQQFVSDASSGEVLWATPITGRLPYPLKHPGGIHHSRFVAESGGESGDRYPSLYRPRVRPVAGIEILSSGALAEEDQGNLLVTNCMGIRGILNFSLHEDGAGYRAEEETPLLVCGDPQFRPVDIEIGPDGALYVADWHNALIGHLQHNLRDPNRDHRHGRIWRITYPARAPLESVDLSTASIPQLLGLLKSPENRTRYRVRRELAGREAAAVVDELHKWVGTSQSDRSVSELHLLEVLWVFQTHETVERELLRRLLEARDHRVRAAAVHVLSFWLDRVANSREMLRDAVHDPHPRVRLEAVRAISFLDRDAAELALDVLQYDMDAYLQYTLDETMRVLEP